MGYRKTTKTVNLLGDSHAQIKQFKQSCVPYLSIEETVEKLADLSAVFSEEFPWFDLAETRRDRKPIRLRDLLSLAPDSLSPEAKELVINGHHRLLFHALDMAVNKLFPILADESRREQTLIISRTDDGFDVKEFVPAPQRE